MMQAGIFTGYFPYGLEETAKKIRGARLQHRAARPALQGRRPVGRARSPRTRPRRCATRSATTTCRSAASRATRTSSIPDKAEREKRVGYLKEIIRNARHFGTPYVISETGTYNTESDWVHHPKNKTEEGFEECRKVIADLAQTAYDHGAVFLLETYVNNVVGSVEETVRMFAQVDHPGPRPADGPDQLFRDPQHRPAWTQILNQVFDTLSDKIRIAHAKDVKRSGDDKSREARRHRRRGRAGEPHLPRRRRDRAAGARPRLAELRPLSASGWPRSTRTSRSSSSI